jgi:UDP-galactopyranose mutase
MKIIIVGAGLSSAVASAILKQKGHEVIVFESRPHIAGNCYDSDIKGIKVHNYGPHAFHTEEKWVWDFVNKYDSFNDFKLQVKAKIQDGRVINIPYNKKTELAVGNWDSERIVREIFIPYSEKHWGSPWDQLPKSFTGRLPQKRDDDLPFYHLDQYQGIPKSGYTQWISNMFDGCRVNLGCKPSDWKREKYDLLIYTGSIDSYFDYCFGHLDYRSLKFNFFEGLKTDTHQLNECNTANKWTRTIDHSHWYDQNVEKTIFSREFSEQYSINNKETERFYPEPHKSQEIYNKYKNLETDTIFLGRLGTYKYLDMDDCIKQVFTILNKKLNLNIL